MACLEASHSWEHSAALLLSAPMLRHSLTSTSAYAKELAELPWTITSTKNAVVATDILNTMNKERPNKSTIDDLVQRVCGESIFPCLLLIEDTSSRSVQRTPDTSILLCFFQFVSLSSGFSER